MMIFFNPLLNWNIKIFFILFYCYYYRVINLNFELSLYKIKKYFIINNIYYLIYIYRKIFQKHKFEYYDKYTYNVKKLMNLINSTPIIF